MTDWKWEQKECKKQKELFEGQRKDSVNFITQAQRNFRTELKQKMVIHMLMFFLICSDMYNI